MLFCVSTIVFSDSTVPFSPTIDGTQYEFTLPKVNTLELNHVKQDGKTIISYSPISFIKKLWIFLVVVYLVRFAIDNNLTHLFYINHSVKYFILPSTISMKLDIQTLFQSLDPVSIKKLEIKFKDGSVYTLMDREHRFDWGESLYEFPSMP